MSRGPGRIQRGIESAIDADPDNAFTTEDLCELVYPGVEAEKKHRVAVLRAMREVAERRGLALWRSERVGGTLILLNPLNVMSYAMARLKGDFAYHYRYKFIPGGGWKEAQLRSLLAPGGRNHKDIIPGGAWHIHVEVERARRSGDGAGVQQLADELNRSIDKQLKVLVG